MATQAYHNWVAAREPYRLAEWMNDLVVTMRGRGYTVYHYPDIDHLTTNQPQDHTPFSYTGWPIDSPFGVAFGVDIMPKNGDARSLAPLGRQIIADKDAGHPALAGLKYINWTDESGLVWQTSWKPTKATRPNTDKGHLHLSGRSDSANWRAIGYDPVARMNGGNMSEKASAIIAAWANGEPGAGWPGGSTSVEPVKWRKLDEAWQRKVEAALTADAARDAAEEARDRDLVTLVKSIAAMVTAGGGSFDTTAVLTELRAGRTEATTAFAALQQRLAVLQGENDALKAQIAAVPTAAVTALVAELTD